VLGHWGYPKGGTLDTDSLEFVECDAKLVLPYHCEALAGSSSNN